MTSNVLNAKMIINKRKGGDVTVIKHKITKDKEGQYYTLPFDVPEGVVKITVSYDYYKPTKGVMGDLKPSNTIDIGLMDEAGNFLGWSGSSHSTIYVGQYDSSAGYLCKKIKEGKWQIIIGAYHVMDEGVEVTYDIDFEYAGEVLLYGDLHMHSTASDGVFSAWELGSLAKEKGLDFIAIANHNNFSENLALPHIDGLTFIPAVEWTHYKGHMNFFGVPAPFENSFIANSAEEMRSIINHARGLGATISVNHPDCPICPYKWDDDSAFDMMEIWNGPMRPSNIKAVKRWTSLLKEGRHIPAVGGSDFHKPGQFAKLGVPVTAVYSASASKDDILSAIKQGNCFVTESKNSVKIRLIYGDCVMGQTAEYDENTWLEIYTDSDRIVIVTDKGEKELMVRNGHIKVRLRKVKFAYVKICKKFGKLGLIRAISNPIYFK
ncbi:MAG: hypothetical protein E7544_05805 [Ruminococcaceae bacterium]|nr:hypothetical protein [Oscillospiraceae bacterium]